LSFATRSAAAGSPSGGLDRKKCCAPFVQVYSAHLSKKLVKVVARGVHVEQPCALGPRVRERVHDPDGRSDEGARTESELLLADQKLGLSFEHVEGIDLIVVVVRLGALETGLELELDERELIPPGLDGRDALVRLEPFAFSGAEHDGFGRGGETGAGRHVETVEPAGLSTVLCSEISRKTAVRRVEVEESSWRRAPESVDDPGRRADKCVRRDELLLVVDQNGEPALEDVERIRVLPVEVRTRSRLRGIEMRFGNAELLEVGLDHDPSTEKRFALAGSEHDSFHCGRV
jgi:hypothetical protein